MKKLKLYMLYIMLLGIVSVHTMENDQIASDQTNTGAIEAITETSAKKISQLNYIIENCILKLTINKEQNNLDYAQTKIQLSAPLTPPNHPGSILSCNGHHDNYYDTFNLQPEYKYSEQINSDKKNS